MPKNRTITRANRKKKRREQKLDIRNYFGIKDLTPFNAVLLMRGEAYKMRWK